MRKTLGTVLIALLFASTSLMLLNSSFMFRVVAQDVSGGGLFRFVWDEFLGPYPFFGGYCIVSDRVFSLDVHAVSLPDVGNCRFFDRSAIVEGVRQAVKIRPGAGDVKELKIPLWSNLFMKLNVSISFHLVDSWETYKALVESANNTIIVNTHDEYLPVPDGYKKEEWVDRIADFMLNRWGTWVHAGGYPLYRVWYQNGTREEWGEEGFKCLMRHIGKGNLTCYPPPSWNPEDPATFNLWAAQGIGINWFLNGEPVLRFWYSNPGYPINYGDFQELYVGGVYSLISPYDSGAIIRYSKNQSTFNFGLYIHMGVMEFYLGNGKEVESSALATGFISTAAGIYGEFYYAASRLYGRGGDSAAEAIQEAEKAGRTVGLAEAKNLFQNALDAFASENYKLSAAYAIQAKLTAEKAATPSTVPQLIATIAITAVSISIGAYYKINNKKNKRDERS